MADLKTRPTDENVERFLNTVTDEKRRRDCFALLQLMSEVTGAGARMWGPSIVGLGEHHYRYDSGREGDTFLVGFSPRKQNLTLYATVGLDRYGELLKTLGRHTTGKGCLYIKSVDDIDPPTLRSLLQQCVQDLTERGAS